MADKFLTLLDITKMSGTDQAVGIVEEVRTYAPELDVLRGRPVKGTTYKALVREALPAGPAFRTANAGSYVVASRWGNRINQCYFLDGQMRIDEMVLRADEHGPAWVMANEATGVMKQKLITVGAQFYYGTSNDAAGFPGLVSLYDSTNMEVSANASGALGATTSSAWLVVNQPDCVEWIWGQNKGLEMGQWVAQYTNDSSSKQYLAWMNNLSGYIGLSFNFTKSVCRIKNLVVKGTASNQGLTDALVAEALSKFPTGVRPTHLFVNAQQRFHLQCSRSPVYTAGTGSAITSNLPLNFPPIPTESNGIPLICTDSITQVETAS